MAKKSTPTYSDGKTPLTENQKNVLWSVGDVQPASTEELYRADHGCCFGSLKSMVTTLHTLHRLGLVTKTTVGLYLCGARTPLFRERHIWTVTRKGAAWLMVAEREG